MRQSNGKTPEPERTIWWDRETMGDPPDPGDVLKLEGIYYWCTGRVEDQLEDTIKVMVRSTGSTEPPED